MTRKTAKFLFGLALGLTIALATAFGGLMYWVAKEPRPVNELSRVIEKTFEEELAPYSLQIGETWLMWESWKRPFNIRLKKITVLTREKQVFASFPEIALELDLWSLLRGSIHPRSIVIWQPHLSLFQNEDQSISFGFRREPPEEAAPAEAEPEATAPFMGVFELMLSPEEHGNLRKLRHLAIINADANIRSLYKGVFFRADRANLVIKRSRRGVARILAGAHLRYEDFRSSFSSEFTYDRNKPLIEGQVEVKGFDPSVLSSLFGGNGTLKGISLPLSGIAKVALDKEGALQRVQFSAEAGRGEISNERLEKPIPVKWIYAEGRIDNRMRNIEINTLRADLEGIKLGGDAAVALREGDAAIRANLRLQNAAAADVPMLWPPGLAPLTREWVIANITEGTVPEATARIDIKPDDLKQPVLPREAIDATIQLADATIRYLPEHPVVRHVMSAIHIDGLSLDAAIASADYMKNTKLSNGTLLIEDLNADNPYIKLSFDAATSAKDVAQLLALPRLEHAKRLNIDADKIQGSATGSASLGFRFFAPRDEAGNPTGEAEIDYDIKAELKGVSQPGFMNKFDIAEGDGKLLVDTQALEFTGKANVNGASVSDTTVKYLFEPHEGLDTFIDVGAAVVPVASLPRFGYPAPPFIEGKLGVKAKAKLGDAVELSEASIDLTNAAVELAEVGWRKPAGEAASFDIVAEKKNGASDIPSFHLKGKDAEAKGAATLSKDLSSIQSASLEKAAFGRTDLSRVEYSYDGKAFSLSVAGSYLDLGFWSERQKQQESDFSFADFPAMAFKGDIATIRFGEERIVRNFKGELNCDARICKSAGFTGTTGAAATPFDLRIMRNPKGRRQLSLHTQDAGSFLRALDLYDSLQGGDLAVTGNYSDGAKGSLLNGRLDIRNYTIRNAPVLAKILSLASLTGFIDLLQGNGISFNRLAIPFTLKNDVIAIRDAKMHGPSIGMTMEGSITMPRMLLDLKGTVVPSYALNTMVGKVPIVGQILTGGEGQAVFAANYSVRGTEKDPQVTVNPLSILTPGFLRGLFDIFDQPKKEEE